MSSKTHIRKHRSVGLYSYEQEKYVSPFQYLAQIAIGTFVVGMGMLLLYLVASARAKEIQTNGAAESHLGGWLSGCAITVIGVFMAHAGVDFYCRKIAKKRRLARYRRRREKS